MNKVLQSRRPILALALVFLVAGAGLLASPVIHAAVTQVSALQAKGIWQKWKNAWSAQPATVASKPGEPVCWLRVKSCKISTLVTQESNADALYRFPAIRQIPFGASVIFAHRDVHFRGLATVHLGDSMSVESPDGAIANYTVRSIRVILPEQVSATVEDPESRGSLHLLTCYPFHYIGAAPKRFLVTATRRDR